MKLRLELIDPGLHVFLFYNKKLLGFGKFLESYGEDDLWNEIRYTVNGKLRVVCAPGIIEVLGNLPAEEISYEYED